jgi:hypothetical protein
VKPEGGAPWAHDFGLLQAKLLLDTFAFGHGIQWHSQLENDLSTDAQCATLHYCLPGLGYREAGGPQKETQALTKVVNIDGGSDLGTSAADLLKNP